MHAWRIHHRHGPGVCCEAGCFARWTLRLWLRDCFEKNGFSRCYMFLPWLKHRLVRLEDVWPHMVCTHAIEARGTCEGRQLLPETLAWKISTAPQPALAGSLCEYSVTTTTNANCEWNGMCEKMRSYRCLIININFINIVHTSQMHANSMYCEQFTTYIHVN